jgi:hypothetical protein
MKTKKILKTFFLMFLLILTACGGGSSGTGLGGDVDGGQLRFAGIIVSPDGKEVSNAKLKLLNTDDVVFTNEAGSFELQPDFSGDTATFEVSTNNSAEAVFSVSGLNPNSETVDLSIAYDSRSASADPLSLTMRGLIVRSCASFFLNTRTIRQRSAITEGLKCTIEGEFKRNGLPVDDIVFELQHRSCDADAPWQFTSSARTGTSGPGAGEIDFEFKNDERHCVYRLVGPINQSDIPISVHVHSLRKQKFDR